MASSQNSTASGNGWQVACSNPAPCAEKTRLSNCWHKWQALWTQQRKFNAPCSCSGLCPCAVNDRQKHWYPSMNVLYRCCSHTSVQHSLMSCSVCLQGRGQSPRHPCIACYRLSSAKPAFLWCDSAKWPKASLTPCMWLKNTLKAIHMCAYLPTGLPLCSTCYDSSRGWQLKPTAS